MHGHLTVVLDASERPACPALGVILTGFHYDRVSNLKRVVLKRVILTGVILKRVIPTGCHHDGVSF